MRAVILALTLGASAASADELRIATGGHFPPYIFNPGTAQVSGLDKDLMDAVCAAGGYTCTWVDLPMNDVFQALARGDVDVVTGGFGYSTARDTLVDFTCPYVASEGNSGQFIGTSPETDLVTARIGALDQSLYLAAMQNAKRNVQAFATEEDAIAALALGEVDVVFGSHNAMRIAREMGSFFDLGEYPTASGGVVLGVAETAPALRQKLNDILAGLSADGTLSQLQVQWLGEDQGDVIARCYDLNALT